MQSKGPTSSSRYWCSAGQQHSVGVLRDQSVYSWHVVWTHNMRRELAFFILACTKICAWCLSWNIFSRQGNHTLRTMPAQNNRLRLIQTVTTVSTSIPILISCVAHTKRSTKSDAVGLISNPTNFLLRLFKS